MAAFSATAISNPIKAPLDRKAAAGSMIEGIGGRLHHLFFRFGEEDIVALMEAAEDAGATLDAGGLIARAGLPLS